MCLAMQMSYPFSKAPGLALALRTTYFNSDLYFNLYSPSSKINGNSPVKKKKKNYLSQTQTILLIIKRLEVQKDHKMVDPLHVHTCSQAGA